MKVTCHVSDWMKRFTDGRKSFELKLEPGTTLKVAVLLAGIPKEELGFATVNNAMADESQVLFEGDDLRIYPTIIGG